MLLKGRTYKKRIATSLFLNLQEDQKTSYLKNVPSWMTLRGHGSSVNSWNIRGDNAISNSCKRRNIIRKLMLAQINPNEFMVSSDHNTGHH